MKKRKITWIRHGQSLWNAIGKWQGHSDIELSDLGKQQAQSLASRLDHKQFDAVYASDLKRALNTGQTALPGADIKVDARLKEINFGIYEGKMSGELTEDEQADVDDWWADPYARKLEGGESMLCVNERVKQWIESLPEQCHIAAFTHGGVVRNAVWQVVGRPIDGSWRLPIDNTSITVIEYLDDKIVLRKVNDHAHIENM